MKLGTKIILGFLAVCFIFIAISSLVVFSLVGVHGATIRLHDEVLAGSDLVSNMRASVAKLSGEISEYSSKLRPEDWKSVESTRKLIVEYSEKLRIIVRDGTSYDQKLSDMLIEAENHLETLYEVATKIPTFGQELVQSREKVAQTHELLIEKIDIFRQSLIKFLNQSFKTGNISEDSFYIELLEQADAIRYKAMNMNANVVKGLYFQDLKYLDMALDDTAILIKSIASILEKANEPENREILTNLLKAAQGSEQSIKIIRNNLAAITDNDDQREEIRVKVNDEYSKLSQAVSNLTTEFTVKTSAAVLRIIYSMIIGIVLGFLISIVLGFFLTKGITVPISRIIMALTDGAQEVDNASGQLSSASNTLAEGASENAASLEETSAALEQLTSMTKRNSDNAISANSLMAQATDAVSKAESSMTNVINAMGQIATSGNEIGKIIKTIDEIAFQTNLLALNAAVEAARAGEAGAGFAVVADEVRNLAIRSADAAKNTADLIAATISNINSGSEMVNSTSENFHLVATHSSKVAQLVNEVAEASKEQSQGINQIAIAMSQMDKVTQANAASAEESASAASQLSLQAEQLMDSVENINSLVFGGPKQSGASKGRDSKQSRKSSDKKVDKGKDKTKALTAKSSKSSKTSSNKALPMDNDDDFEF
ncbi:MAG: methyl-accepting chemotaxis protein [Deltaproteobacteria bacterium]|jgi:methyl-accepting chemotaxis protein|nr:methyl-accepting chemotaxis protein [Deltaproteobacteria bacterium]